MKLHPDSSSAHNTITAYGAAYVEVNGKRYTCSMIVLPEAPVLAWPVSSFAALERAHFNLLIKPSFNATVIELLIFGSGAQLRFPHPSLTEALIAQKISVETMDCHAACRTYNILAAEGRKVAAALLIESYA